MGSFPHGCPQHQTVLLVLASWECWGAGQTQEALKLSAQDGLHDFEVLLSS